MRRAIQTILALALVGLVASMLMGSRATVRIQLTDRYANEIYVSSSAAAQPLSFHRTQTGNQATVADGQPVRYCEFINTSGSAVTLIAYSSHFAAGLRTITIPANTNYCEEGTLMTHFLFLQGTGIDNDNPLILVGRN